MGTDLSNMFRSQLRNTYLRNSIANKSFQTNTIRAFATKKQQPKKSNGGGERVVVVDGVRTPFLTSNTDFQDLMSHDLARMALHGLLTKTALDPKLVDRVIMGTVIQESLTSNVAREAALGANIPKSVVCNTVTMACISSNLAIANGVDLIKSGQADIILAGGTETMSDVPIRFSRPIRKRLLNLGKAKTTQAKLKLFSGLKLKDLAPQAPAIAEFSTGEVMGHSADRLAARFGVSRNDQDLFAMRSHHGAANAAKNGIFDDEVIAAKVPPKMNVVNADNGVRGDSTMEKMGKLRAAFVKPHGTVTAANSSFLTDGGSATLLMSESKAKELGYTPKAYVKDYVFVGCDPKVCRRKKKRKKKKIKIKILLLLLFMSRKNYC